MSGINRWSDRLFGSTAAEAMAAGCVVIDADHPESAVDEVLDDAGFLATPTIDGVAAVLEEALAGKQPPIDPVERAQRFDWGQVAEDVLEAYRAARDAKGTTLSAKKRRQLGRLRREQKRGRFRSKQERNLSHGLGGVQRVVSVLDVDDTLCEQACQLFRSAHSEGLLPGRTIESMAAASVYAACRCNGRTLPLADVVEAARVGGNRVTNAYAVLNEELGLPAQPMHPHEYLPRLASDLDVPDEIRRRARALAERAEEAQVVLGSSPPGFAAACLYRAAQQAEYRLTQAAVADVAGVTTTTVRGHRNALRKELG